MRLPEEAGLHLAVGVDVGLVCAETGEIVC